MRCRRVSACFLAKLVVKNFFLSEIRSDLSGRKVTGCGFVVMKAVAIRLISGGVLSETAGVRASREGLIPKLRQPPRPGYLHRRVKIGYGGNPATVRTFRPWRRSLRWCQFKGAGHEEHRIARADPTPPPQSGEG